MALDWDNIIITTDEYSYSIDAEQRMILFSGAPGVAASVEVVGTETLDPGEDAYVENLGSEQNAKLKFGIPRGASGVWGDIVGDLSDQTDLQNALDAKAPVILSSASGSIASFSDGSPAPVTALSVGIEPVQEGTGDPSPDNVRPISGHTQAVVTRTGKNLFDYSARTSNYYLDTSTGQPVPQNGYYVTPYIPVQAGKPIVFLPSGSGRRWIYDVNKNPVTYINNSSLQVYTPPIDGYIRVTVSSTSTYATKYQIEYGTAPTAYEEYQGQTVTIDLGEERYGGTIDVLTGTMTVTHKYMKVGNNFSYSSGNIFAYATSEPKKPANNFAVANIISSAFAPSSQGNLANGNHIAVPTTTDYIRINAVGYTDDTTFANDFGNVDIVFELAQPLTVQLSPSTLNTLKGQNSIWADTGDVAVEYRADTKLFIEGQIAEANTKTRQMMTTVTDQMVAPKNLTSGDLVIVNDDLYKATANIASGATLTVGTNVTKITLAEYIQSLL